MDEKEKVMGILEQEYDTLKLNNSLAYKSASNLLQNNNENLLLTSTATVTPKRKNILPKCFDLKLANQSQSRNLCQEIEDYLNADHSYIFPDADSDDVNVLSFSQENQPSSRSLSRLAKIVWAIRALNTNVERLFSAAKKCCHRKTHTPEL